MQTHVISNQATPLVDYNLFSTDRILTQLVQDHGGNWGASQLSKFGEFAGSATAIDWAVQANRNEPELRTFNRFGERRDEVEFHPAWHQLMKASVEHGVHSLPWQESRAGAHVVRAALMYMDFQNEAGHCCPISMTYAAVPALRRQPEIARLWEPQIISRQYDARFLPAPQKTGLLIGMGMTEKQGGSDVRANTSKAVPEGIAGSGKPYRLTGHKWFCSAPMSDAFLILAQASKGVSCFLVPRWLPDGTKNNIFIQRLKDKLGNRSNASSEIEFENALGWLIGEEGRGVPTIIEMVNHTRLDCTLGATALMRQATLQAIHHATQRSAFGKKLIDQPAMRNVLADLSLEWEAAMRMTFRVATAYDAAATSPSEALFKRISSAIAKYWVCKRVPMHVAEALECLGGNGYVEESPMPRLFRESPLNGIWEGSGNVICLDVLRAISKEPEALDTLIAEIELAQGMSTHVNRFTNQVKNTVARLKKNANEMDARYMVEQLAIALQASLMLRNATGPAADMFVSSRIRRQSGLVFGTLQRPTHGAAIIDRAYLAR